MLFRSACLASESPVLSYLPLRPGAALKESVAASAGALGRAAWAELVETAPVVAGTLRALGGGEGRDVPTAMRGLLTTLCERSALCCEGPSLPADGGGSSGSSGPPSCLSDECLRTGICCGLPKVRGRAAFAADSSTGGSSYNKIGRAHV